MKDCRALYFALPLLLASCGSITLPAAVRLENGEALIGTTTAAVSGGTFTVNNTVGSIGCSGSYDALDTRPVLSTAFKCSDGRYGTLTVLRTPDGRGGSGSVVLSDGQQGRVAFGDQASAVLSPGLPASSMSVMAQDPSFGGLSSTTSGRTYSGNCPTPESLDAAGRRCGARSAASKAGGYDGYSSSASNSPSYSVGTTYVRGYYRKNGTYVRSHSRRR